MRINMRLGWHVDSLELISTNAQPEKGLIAAVIIRALKDLVHPNKRIKERAVQWFDEDEISANEPFGVIWCCEQISGGVWDGVKELAEEMMLYEKEGKGRYPQYLGGVTKKARRC